MRDPERIVSAEGCAVACAGCPPVSCRVDHWVSLRQRVIFIGEIFDPVDHGSVTETVAFSTVGVVLDVEGTRKGDAISAPASSVLNEVLSLDGTGRDVRPSKMIAASDEADFSCSGVLRREVWTDVTCPFSSFDIGKGHPAGFDGVPINIRLMTGDVNSLGICPFFEHWGGKD